MRIIHPTLIEPHFVMRLTQANWQPRLLLDGDLPRCIQSLPSRIRLCAMASGSMIEPVEMWVSGRQLEVVGGITSFRLAPEDESCGGLVNKDQFLVVRNSLWSYLHWPFVSVGPLRPDKDHWLPDLPPEVYSANLLEA